MVCQMTPKAWHAHVGSIRIHMGHTGRYSRYWPGRFLDASRYELDGRLLTANIEHELVAVDVAGLNARKNRSFAYQDRLRAERRFDV